MIRQLKTILNTIRGSSSGASRGYYRRRALDENRANGDRPYEHLDDEELLSEYVAAVGRIRDADEGGLHLSPVIDRAWNLSEEWRERGNDESELTAALQEAGYDVESAPGHGATGKQ